MVRRWGNGRSTPVCMVNPSPQATFILLLRSEIRLLKATIVPCFEGKRRPMSEDSSC